MMRAAEQSNAHIKGVPIERLSVLLSSLILLGWAFYGLDIFMRISFWSWYEKTKQPLW